MHKRLVLTLALALTGSLALAVAAHAAAGTVTIYDYGDYKVVSYTGTDGPDTAAFGGSFAAHTVTITQAGIADPGPIADPGNLCALTGPETLTCTDAKFGAEGRASAEAAMGDSGDITTATGTQYWRVWGGNGEDHLTGSDGGDDELYGDGDEDVLDLGGATGRPYTWQRADGGQGNDLLRGGPSDDQLNGDVGTDDLDGGAGSDSLYGGDGVDSLRGGPGDDYLNPDTGDGETAEGGEGSDWFSCIGDPGETYAGGPGFDGIECFGGVYDGDTWHPDNYAIDLAAGIVKRTNHVQTTSMLSSIEDVETYDGNDVLIGTDGANSLWSGPGDDSVDGRGGTDYIWTGAGSDTVETGDGTGDRADAGPAADTCHADQVDDVFGCEALTLAPAPSGPAADRTAPDCKVTVARGSRASGRISLTATCNEAATLGAEAIGRLKRPTRTAFAASRVGDVTLGTASSRAAANAKVRVVVRVSKRYRRALPKRARIRVVLHATDAAGNQSAVSRTVRMR
jgi:Ca2+-binding RTX toxin-like protein